MLTLTAIVLSGCSDNGSIFPSDTPNKDAAIDAISQVAVTTWVAEKCGAVKRDDMQTIIDELMNYVARSPLTKKETMHQYSLYTGMVSDGHTSCNSDSSKGHLLTYNEWVNKLN